MSSWVEVANMIGAHIGTETRITSPDDDRTLARSIRAVWDLQRRAALRDGAWNFAVARHQLPALTSEPPFGFAYQYRLPAACLRVLEIADNAAYKNYQCEGGLLLCDVEGPLPVRVLVDVEEPGKWDAGFTEAFALRVAWAIGRKIAGSAFDKDKVWADYRRATEAAKRVDALENPPIEREESDWVMARTMPAEWQPNP
jgi:hypothetical protein